jgi:hypothetical protein
MNWNADCGTQGMNESILEFDGVYYLQVNCNTRTIIIQLRLSQSIDRLIYWHAEFLRNSYQVIPAIESKFCWLLCFCKNEHTFE